MVVDCSGYLGAWPYWQNPHADATGDGLVRLMDRWGVDHASVTSLCGVFYDDAQGNEMMFDACGRHPERLSPAVAVSVLTDRDNKAYIGECARRGARVLRLFPAYHGYRLSPDNGALMELVGDAHALGMLVCIPIRLIMNWGLAAVPVADVIAFVKKNRDVPFLIDGFNAGEYLPLLELAGECENVTLGTTALTRYRGIEDLVKGLGAHRIAAGMAAPHQYVLCGLRKVRDADISPEAVRDILGSTAVRILGLAEKGGALHGH